MRERRSVEPGLGIDAIHLGRDNETVHGSCPMAAAIGPAEQPGFSAESNTAQSAFGGIVKGYGARDAALPAGIHRLRRSWMGHRDRGVGSTKRRQAVMSMSCELELLLGRPYDLPGCAASADP